jgi:hypothetical protein
MKTGGGGAFGNIAEGLAWDDAWGNGRWSWLAGQGGALKHEASYGYGLVMGT